jgi:hypothetical protein
VGVFIAAALQLMYCLWLRQERQQLEEMRSLEVKVELCRHVKIEDRILV